MATTTLDVTPPTSQGALPQRSVVVIGAESAGKSQLLASLTRTPPRSSNFRGTTVACELFTSGRFCFTDTPGILQQSDTETTRIALARLRESDDVVLVVVQATHLDEQLALLLPLVQGRPAVVVVTFWDRVQARAESTVALERLSAAVGVPFIPVDARRLSDDDRARLRAALAQPRPISDQPLRVRAGWRIEPAPTLIDHPRLGAALAILLLVLPAVAAVAVANSIAGVVDPWVQAGSAQLVQRAQGLPDLLGAILVGRYGLITMGPLLFVWAVPTAVIYALILGGYKASGLLDRLSVAINPLLRPFGLSGRDLVRVMMGFGCNVPAVISTRACSACSRGLCISTIAFGAACSYQLGATLSVFAAMQLPLLVVPYLLYLTATTLIYTRLSAPPQARSPLNLLLVEGRAFLVWPHWRAIWQEARGTIGHFFAKAIPIFFAITILASILDWLGVVAWLAAAFTPLMQLVGLPGAAALPVVMASIRKDGVLLFAEPETLALLSPGQLLAGVYLAGVLLPCLVTALTIAREQSARFAALLIGRQALAAVGFTAILGWGSLLVGW